MTDLGMFQNLMAVKHDVYNPVLDSCTSVLQKAQPVVM